ncbi:MAG: iron permease [Thermoleophilia bacterium]|nr:iron permease [Thermoleophilia bacterium]
MVTSVVNASVIVFREGLEAVLIFAAITASFLGARQGYRRPVILGVAAAFLATVATWFAMTTVITSLPLSEDVLLALTGIVAVIVLLLVMNWFFHKVYWTDHIKELNSKKRELVTTSESGEQVKYWGFVALGFTAVYREGFEVVLFLQNLNIVAGGTAVFWGVMLGLAGTTIVGFLTFYLHHKLPYKRMLVLTGVLLGVVLVVMVGGSARTLQALEILPTTPLPVSFPDWWARWFELVATWETVLMQLFAGAFVIGSYYAAEWWSKEKRRRAKADAVSTPPMIVELPSATPTPAPVPEPVTSFPVAPAPRSELPPIALRPPLLRRTATAPAPTPVATPVATPAPVAPVAPRMPARAIETARPARPQVVGQQPLTGRAAPFTGERIRFAVVD